MYKFIDVNETPVNSLPAEAMQLNGQYLENLVPGYRTLTAAGREVLAPDIKTIDVANRDGLLYRGKRYPARVITVSYQLKAATREAFRAAFNTLCAALDVEEARLIFADEPDVYFTGTPSGIGEIEPGRLSVTGEIELTCTDPFKYSVTEYEVPPLDDDGKTFSIFYQGTVPTAPILETTFAPAGTDTENLGGDCGFVAFVNDRDKIIQLGDVDEPDGFEFNKSQTLVNQTFTSYSGTTATNWPENSATLQPLAHIADQVGSVAISTDPSPWLTKQIGIHSSGTGDYWHGPAIERTIPAQASGHVGSKDWQLTYQQRLCMSNAKTASKEAGLFMATVSGVETQVINGETIQVTVPIGAVSVFKEAVGTTGKIHTYVHGKYKEETVCDISHKNWQFGYSDTIGGPDQLTTTILKTGQYISFNIAGLNLIYSDESIADLEATKVSFYLATKKTLTPLRTNGIYWARFVNLACDTWKDIPNKFASGDVLTADCSNAEVRLNGLSMPSLGALGNDWETFKLQPGYNQILTAHSEWVDAGKEPAFKLRYREVFL